MPKPRAMKQHENNMRIERKDPEFDLLQHLLGEVNDLGLSLSDVAAKLQIGRPKLERWLKDCGYRYALKKQLVPNVPEAVAEPATTAEGQAAS